MRLLLRCNKRCEPLAFTYKSAIAVNRAAVKTALHATRLRSASHPGSSTPRLPVSCAGTAVARFSMSPAISATQEAPPIVGIIDSDPVARAALKTLLQPVGVDVMNFDTAESYLLSGSSRALACLIVDLLLPGMSGLELLRRLRSNGNDVPVILLADESDVPTAVAAMREGATDFIEKPYVNVAILKQVQKLIRGQSGGVLPA
jgi:PleD family two-component response regulator